MRARNEKGRPEGETSQSTSNPAAQNAPDMTARMHFYAVRNEGDRLRWADASRKSKKPDRMVGR